jgi:hypothetical protein
VISDRRKDLTRHQAEAGIRWTPGVLNTGACYEQNPAAKALPSPGNRASLNTRGRGAQAVACSSRYCRNYRRTAPPVSWPAVDARWHGTARTALLLGPKEPNLPDVTRCARKMQPESRCRITTSRRTTATLAGPAASARARAARVQDHGTRTVPAAFVRVFRRGYVSARVFLAGAGAAEGR